MKTSSFVNIDSHAHLTSDELFSEVDAIIQRALQKNVQIIININTDQQTLQRGIDLQKKYPGILYNTGSTTPHDVDAMGREDFPIFEKAAREGNLIAIGETGLDYYYAHSKKETQIEYLRKYLALAVEVRLPVIFHCRGDEAFADLFTIAKDYGNFPAVLHCFTGNQKQAEKVIELGWYLSISGIVTFKKSADLQQVVEGLPLERLFAETDSPYLAPQSKRGQINEPANIIETVEKIADLKKLSREQVSQTLRKNVCEFFKISCNML